jgi:phage-related minor tail protein
LRVKVPKDCFPGGTFKVTVPVKHRPGDSDQKDGNKLPRDLQEALDVFGKAYDEWCTAQSKVDSSFETFKQKQGKFDKLAKLFPKNLVTPIDSNYLKQVVRRARQNKYKRSKTAAAAAARENSATKEEEQAAAAAEKNEVEEESAKEESDEEEESVAEPPKKHRVVNIPTTGSNYLPQTFSAADFQNS